MLDQIKSLIRERLAHYDQINPHPVLNRYGQEDNYEWKQYFLRDDQTTLSKCPFTSHHKKRTLTKIQVISPFLKKQPFKEDVWL